MEMLEVSFRLLAELWTSEIAGLPALGLVVERILVAGVETTLALTVVSSAPPTPRLMRRARVLTMYACICILYMYMYVELYKCMYPWHGMYLVYRRCIIF